MRETTVEQLASALEQGATLVDVRDAFNVAGGTSAWVRSGRPIEK
jgi:rhodanese-related sulfurtransferase